MNDQSEKPVVPTFVTTKSVMDEHKGWFDYASCCLGLTAWDAAVFYVCFNTWADRLDLGPTLFLYIFAIISGAIFAAFLHLRLFKMTSALVPVIVDMVGIETWQMRVVAPFLMFWRNIGHQMFILALVIHLLYLATGLYGKG